MNISDDDLIIVGGLTAGVGFQHILDSTATPTVFVIGPTFDRETALDLSTFAARSDARVIVPLLSGTTRESYAADEIELLPVRALDQRYAVRQLATQFDRVVGIFETADPADGTYTPSICGIGIEAVLEVADEIYVERNSNAPRIPGLEIPVSRVEAELEATYELPRLSPPDPTAAAKAVAENVLTVVPDGATLQLGRGNVPTAVTDALIGRDGFRMHTGIVDGNGKRLIEEGVISDGSAVASPLDGCPYNRPVMTAVVAGPDREFYQWVEASRSIVLGGLEQTHQPSVVSKNESFTAINSALQVDLSGQINAERIGSRQLSAPGGQPDFVRSARLSEGGRSIIAITNSVKNRDISKIVGGIPENSVVTTPRYEPEFIVTQENVVDCRTSSTRERAEELIAAADPAYRESLRSQAQKQKLIPEAPVHNEDNS